MILTVNGEASEREPGLSVVGLLESLGIAATRTGIAVAVNLSGVPRSSWDEVVLHDADEVEIIEAVQGG